MKGGNSLLPLNNNKMIMTLRNIFFAASILLITNCGNSDKIIDWDKRKATWIQGLSTSPEDYHVLISIPKSNVETDNLKNAEERARLELAEKVALEMKMNNEPKAAADFLSSALLKIEKYLGEDLMIPHEQNNFQELDVLIYKEMSKLSSGLEFVVEPSEKIVLNRENDYIGILNFEVHLNGHKSGSIDVTVDLAGLRQEKILTSAYSVLINDLPNVLTKPWIILRADMFQSLRADGNELTQIVYRSLETVSQKVAIEKEYPSVVKLTKDEASADVVLFPNVILKTQEEYAYIKVSSNWKIKIGVNGTDLIGKKIVSTSKKANNAQRDMLIKLDEHMKKEMLEKILASLTAK